MSSLLSIESELQREWNRINREIEKRDREREFDLDACYSNPIYFLNHFGHVYDATARGWIPFSLWTAQQRSLATIHTNRLAIVLKARQLGFSWLIVGYILWLMLFRPAATILVFSKTDDEAIELLGFRLKGMYDHLDDWLISKCKAQAGVPDKAHHWMLANGSRAMALPTTRGRSYTGTFVLIDEADHIENLNKLLNSVKPTIDAGGKLVLLSSVDKSTPESVFKRLYTGARIGENSYTPIFEPWQSRPGRDAAWYEEQRRDSLSKTGALDDLHQEYPATDTEALAPRSLDKRIHPDWLRQCYVERRPLSGPHRHENTPAIPALDIYYNPQPGFRYVIGADPAEGNPTSDDSALTVLEEKTGEEVASLAGKYQPEVLAAHAAQLAKWYNGAAVLCERNNHGHAFILWMKTESRTTKMLTGEDNKTGWNTTAKSKALLYDLGAEAFREQETILHNLRTFHQLASIEGSTLRAPEGQHDDRAMGYVLALAAINRKPARTSLPRAIASGCGGG